MSVSLPSTPRAKPQLPLRPRSAPASVAGSGASTPHSTPGNAAPGLAADDFPGVDAGRAEHLVHGLDTRYADLEGCKEDCEALYRYVTGNDPGDMDDLLDWCIDSEEMGLFCAASKAYPRNTALVDIDAEPGLARQLRELGALHGVCVHAAPDVEGLSDCLLCPSVTQINVIGDLGDPAHCDPLCNLLGASTFLTCVGLSSGGAVPDKLLGAIAGCRSPVEVVLLDAKGIQGEAVVEGSSGYPGLSALIHKEGLKNIKLLQDTPPLTFPLAACLLAAAALPSMWIEVAGSSGLALVALMLKEGRQARLQFCVRVEDATKAADRIVAASREGKGHIDTVSLQDLHEDMRDPFLDECNVLLENEMERRRRHEAFAAKFGPVAMTKAVSAFGASLPSETMPMSGAAGLGPAFARTGVFSDPRKGAVLASVTKKTALGAEAGAREDLVAFAKELIALGYEEAEVMGLIHEVYHKALPGKDDMVDGAFPDWFTKSIFDVPAHTINLDVTYDGLEAACHTLMDAANARTINLQFRELTEAMGPALHQALEALMAKEPQLNLLLPGAVAPGALRILIDHLAELRPMRVNLDGLALMGQQAEDLDAKALDAIKRFIRRHREATASLVGLMSAMRMRFDAAQIDDLVTWASQECPEAMGPLKELPT